MKKWAFLCTSFFLSCILIFSVNSVAKAATPAFVFACDEKTSYMSNSIDITGFAIDPSGVKKVDIYIDGAYQGTATLKGSRADVEDAYPQYDSSDIQLFEYVANINASSFSYGDHSIRAVATGNTGTVTSMSFTMNNPVPYVSVENPSGTVRVTKASDQLEVRGWATNPSGIDHIDITLDDNPSERITISGSSLTARSDVVSYFNGYPGTAANSGYDVSFPSGDLTSGTHYVRVTPYGKNGRFQTVTASFTVSVSAPPAFVFACDEKTSYMSSSIDVTGFAIDPSGVKKVDIYIDGAYQGTATLKGSRADVEDAYPQYDPSDIQLYEYTANINAANYSYGNHTVTAVATGNTGTVKSMSFTMNNPVPYVSVENPSGTVRVTKASDQLKVSGWATNPSGIDHIDITLDDNPSERITVSGSSLTARSDVVSNFNGYPGTAANSGYDVSFSSGDLTSGTHYVRVTPYGKDGRFQTVTTSFTVDTSAPPAFVFACDSKTSYMSSSIDVTGFAIDPSGVKKVDIYIDGAYQGTATLKGSRADVEDAYPQYDPSDIQLFEYVANINAASYSYGNHTVTAVATGNTGTVKSMSFTMNNPVPYVSVENPSGTVNVTKPSDQLEVRGWATNPSGIDHIDITLDDNPSECITVSGSSLTARSDVVSYFNGYPGTAANSGYDVSFPSGDLTSGTHYVRVTPYGKDGRFQTVTTQFTMNVSIPPAFVFACDSKTSYMSSSIDVTGFAIDPYGVKKVDIYIDGAYQGTATLEGARSDVEDAYPQYDPSAIRLFEYVANINTASYSYGNHTVTAVATGNTGTVKSMNFTMNNPVPYLSVELPTSQTYSTSNISDMLEIKGWATNPSGIDHIAVIVDGDSSNCTTLTGTSLLSRPDVVNALGGYPGTTANSGYDLYYPLQRLAPGSHSVQVVAYGKNGSFQTVTRQFTVSKPQPWMDVDPPSNPNNSPYIAYGLNDDITVGGWAINASTVEDVEVDMDGSPVAATVKYGLDSGDVASNPTFSSYPEAGNSRFTCTIPAGTYATGIHILTVKAYGVDGSVLTRTIGLTIGSPGQHTTSYAISLDDIVAEQIAFYENNKFGYMVDGSQQSATRNYLDPNYQKSIFSALMFLDLKYNGSSLTASDLNGMLAGCGPLTGKGQVFLDAANAYRVNPIYLIAHACNETGYGTSRLANGLTYPGDTSGTLYYNFFGIGAVDSNAVSGGIAAAHEYGWSSVDAAIMGGAEWISEHYIYRSGNPLDTLYKMKWDPANYATGAFHEYATDPNWADIIANIMYRYAYLLNKTTVYYDIPQYN